MVKSWKLLITCVLSINFDIVTSDSTSEKDLLCLPHLCSKLNLTAEERNIYLDNLAKELDFLVSTHQQEIETNDDYVEWNINIPAILITAGGPERGESIVQAHVLMDTVRFHHHDMKVPIEVWHAGEAGMDQACGIWETKYAPFKCFNAYDEAVKIVDSHGENRRSSDVEDINNSGRRYTALAKALGLKQVDLDHFQRATVEPSLDWVRGWPIKPLSLLLTKYNKVMMLDADSIPVHSVENVLFTKDHENSLLSTLEKYGNVFWPDIIQVGESHDIIRQHIVNKQHSGSHHMNSDEASAANAGDSSVEEVSVTHDFLSAESGQLVLIRSRCMVALRVAWIFNAHPVIYSMLHGDKDTFKLAFDWVNSQQQKLTLMMKSSTTHKEVDGSATYFQVKYPPQALGAIGPQHMVDGSFAADVRYGRGKRICGQSLLQRHPDHGAVLFIHRVLAKYNLMNLQSAETWTWVSRSCAVHSMNLMLCYVILF
jgi:hypothetical protein